MIKSNRPNPHLEWINPINTKKVIITSLNKYCLKSNIKDIGSCLSEKEGVHK